MLRRLEVIVMNNQSSMNLEIIKKPKKEDFQHYYIEHFGPMLEEAGFREVDYKGIRWIKVIQDSVLLSINFPILFSVMFNVYYNFQPLFYPVVFPATDGPTGYIQHRETFFNARQYYNKMFHNQDPVYVTPLHEGTKDLVAQYWINVLKRTVLPTLQGITDVRSCHVVYQKHLSLALPIGIGGRNLLEAVYLHDDAECERIRYQVLVPILKEFGENYKVNLGYEWLLGKKTDESGIPVKALIDDISGTKDMLHSIMTENEKRSRKTLKRVLSHTVNQGDGFHVPK